MADVSMARILKAVLFTPAGHGRWCPPFMFWGQPGTAKTMMTYEVAARYRLGIAVEIAVLSDPTDYKGLPAPDEAIRFVKRLLDEKWERMIAAKRGIIFLDEIPHAPPAVQASLLRVVQERVLGDRELPGTVRILLAGNPSGTGAGGWDLLSSFANRLGHVDWVPPDHHEWTSWLISDGGENGAPTETFDPEAEERRVEELWPEAYALARGEFVGWIERRPDFLHKQPPEGDPKASRGWPSRRSLEMAARCRAARSVHGLNETEGDVLVEAEIGLEAATDFATWRHEADLPDPLKLLDGKDTFKHERARMDRTAAVLSACAALVTPKDAKKRKARAAQCWRILTPITREDADVAWPAAEALSRARLGASAWPEDDNPAAEALSVLSTLRDYLFST